MFRTIKQARIAEGVFLLEEGVRQHFSRQEVENMLEKREKDSFDRGLREGRTQGIQETEAKAREDAQAAVDRQLSLLEELVKELNQARGKVLAKAQEDILKLAMVIAARITHNEVRESDVIANNVREAINMAAGQQRIKIRLHPSDVAAIDSCKESLVKTVSSLERIEIVEDGEIIPGGCVVETGDGSVDARLDRQMEEIRKVLLGG